MPRFSPVIIDHFTNPRNGGELPDADVRAFVGNPVCGDQIQLTAMVVDGVVTDIRFRAFGCSPSLAVASLLTTILGGRPLCTAADVDAESIATALGGLAPEQRHVAGLAVDVAHRLFTNFESGVSDDCFTCDV